MYLSIAQKTSKTFNTTLIAAVSVTVAMSSLVSAQGAAELNEVVDPAAPDLPAEVEVKDKLLDDLQNTVAGLKKPQRWKNVIKVPMNVTTGSKDARFYTRQGFGLMQSQWDIEAHRSFVYALDKDSECIGAYIGLLMMSSQNHNPSHGMHLDLLAKVDELKAKKVDGKYYYSLQERLYADLFIAIVEADKEGRLDAMDKLVEESPMDFQALIMKNVLLPLRAGGNTQEKKSLYISRMMERYPYSPMLWMYWLALHQYENDPEYVKDKLLPVAKKLVKWAPEMPGWHMRYGEVLSKSGNYKDADKSYDKAIELYLEWGKVNKIPLSANAGVWQARIFKSVSYYRGGEFDKAIQIATALQKDIPELQYLSEVRGIYLWEVQTLPARLYLARNQKGDLVKARDSLPNRKFSDEVQNISAASMYYTGLRQYIAFRMAVNDGKTEEAKDLKLLLDETNLSFQKTAKNVSTFVDKNYFYRGKIAISIYVNYTNAELERLDNHLEGQETFLKYARNLLYKHASLSMLPRHVIEDFPVKK